MKHIVVKDIKSETKVFKFIYIQDFFFLLFYMSVIYLLGNLVNVLLLVPFYIFSGLVGIFLTVKSSWNVKRRNWESLFIYLRRDMEVYKPIINLSCATVLDKKRLEEADDED
jgi:hypothetical protein